MESLLRIHYLKALSINNGIICQQFHVIENVVYFYTTYLWMRRENFPELNRYLPYVVLKH